MIVAIVCVDVKLGAIVGDGSTRCVDNERVTVVVSYDEISAALKGHAALTATEA